MKKILTIEGKEIVVFSKDKGEYISLTDIARYKNPEEPKDVVKNWLRSKSTLEFLGLWEKINNHHFKGVEFDSFLMQITFPFNRSIIKTTNKPDIGSELLALLENNPNLSMAEISQKLQITPHNVQYYINKLKKTGKIRREGSKKTGQWVVK